MVDHPNKEVVRVALLIRKAVNNPASVERHNSRMIGASVEFEIGELVNYTFYRIMGPQRVPLNKKEITTGFAK